MEWAGNALKYIINNQEYFTMFTLKLYGDNLPKRLKAFLLFNKDMFKF